MTLSNTNKRAWVIDVNMGYGHSRAAFALKDLSGGEILSANDYEGIPARDRKSWNDSRRLYEAISRLKPIPIVGNILFEAFDKFQQIQNFYPRRDLSKPNLQLSQIYRMIQNGFGRHLIEKLSENPLPLVTTFFLPAFFAEYFDYPGDIWCVTTDTDISRTWASLHPEKSRIKYFASNGRVVERLKLYGVRDENIFLTGFPMPKELIGGAQVEILKTLLMSRIENLDPQGLFMERYGQSVKMEFGESCCEKGLNPHPLTLTYSVGGAGAQRGLGVEILKSLKSKILQEKIRLNLVPGVRKDMVEFYKNAVEETGLNKMLGTGVVIPEFDSRADYFAGFNELLKTTDILWTKPSELSFYTGLGIPIVMAPQIGSQEDYNSVWLQYVGGGVPQHDPKFTDEWLFDWINSGGMARMAWSGFIEAPTHGVYRIEDTVLGHKSELRHLPLIV